MRPADPKRLQGAGIALLAVLMVVGGVVSPGRAAAVGSSRGGASPAVTQRVTVTPATGLAARQRVLVKATGFSAHLSLVVIECANKGTSTSAADCNLDGLKAVTSTAAGSVTTHFTVVRGPFGTGKIVCRKAKACLVSVTEASASPREKATAAISFR